MARIGTIKYIDGNGDKIEIPVWEEADVHYPALKIKTPNGVGCLRCVEEESADLPGIRFELPENDVGFAPSGVGSMVDELVVMDLQIEGWLSPIDGIKRASDVSLANDILSVHAGPIVKDMPTMVSVRDKDFIKSIWISGCCFGVGAWEVDLSGNNIRANHNSLATKRSSSNLFFGGRDESASENAIWRVDDVDTHSPFNKTPDKIHSGLNALGGLDVNQDGSYIYGWGYSSSQGADVLYKMNQYGNVSWTVQVEDIPVDYTSSNFRQPVSVSYDGNYVAVAHNLDSGGNEIFQLEIFDSSGNLVSEVGVDTSYEIMSVAWGRNSDLVYVCTSDYLYEIKATDASLQNTYSPEEDSFGIKDVGIGSQGMYIYVHTGAGYVRQLTTNGLSDGFKSNWGNQIKGIKITH